MSAAGLTDVYRYGARFVGYLVLSVILGGLFVGGGIALGANSIITALASGPATDPAGILSSLSLGSLLGALVLVAIGIVVTLTGVVGLVHKLIADASQVGTEVALSNQLPHGVAVADAEAAAGGDVTAPGDAEGTTGREPASGSEQPASPTATEAAEPVTADEEGPEPVPAEDESTEPAPVETEESGSTPVAAEEGSVPESTSADDQQTHIVDEDDESGDDGDLIAGSPVDSDDADSSEAGDTADATDEGQTGATSPQEWSPPDPSEFDATEQPDDPFGEGTEESAADEPEDVSELFGEEAEESADTESSDDAGESGDGPLSDPFDS